MITALQNLIQSGDATRWALLLLQAAILETVLLGLAYIVCVFLRRPSASMRHFLWLSTLLGLSTFPALNSLMPGWEVPILPKTVFVTDTRYLSNSNDSQPAGRKNKAPIADAANLEPATAPDSPKSLPIKEYMAACGLSVWLAGVLIMLSRLLVGTREVRRVSQQAELCSDGSWRELALKLSKQLGLARGVSVRKSEHVSAPLTWNFLHPVILLPSDADEWDVERRSVVLLHELVHIKRHDCLTQLLTKVIGAFYWFNPATWIALNRLRDETEQACDDQVLSLGVKPPAYANLLLEFARSRHPSSQTLWRTVNMAQQSNLELRLKSILDGHRDRRALTPLRGALSALVVITMVLSANAMRPTFENSSGVQQSVSNTSSLSSTAQDQLPKTISIAEAPAITRVARKSADGGRSSSDLTITQSDKPQTFMLDLSKKPSTESLIAALSNPNADMRRHAAWALGILRDKRAIGPLLLAVKDEDPQVSRLAAWSLGEIADQKDVDVLVHALKDKDPRVRKIAVQTLGGISSKSSLGALTQVLDDDDPQVRVLATKTISEIIVKSSELGQDRDLQQVLRNIRNIRSSR